MNSLEKLKILTPLQKLPLNVGDLSKTQAWKSCPKSNKSPNLVTLISLSVHKVRVNFLTLLSHRSLQTENCPLQPMSKQILEHKPL